MPVLAQDRALNDTGQLGCFNASALDGTVSPAQPDPETAGFNRQDCTGGATAADAVGVLVKRGSSSLSGRDYTKISNGGADLPESAELGFDPPTWGCTRDNVTGLIWAVTWRRDSSLLDGRSVFTWFDSNASVNGGNAGSAGSASGCFGLALCNTSAFRDAVNGLAGDDRLCGATDWRVPTAPELESLLDLSSSNGPLLDGVWFPGSSSSDYWSGDNAPSFANGDGAWAVSFSFAGQQLFLKSTTARVRLVRTAP